MTSRAFVAGIAGTDITPPEASFLREALAPWGLVKLLQRNMARAPPSRFTTVLATPRCRAEVRPCGRPLMRAGSASYGQIVLRAQAAPPRGTFHGQLSGLRRRCGFCLRRRDVSGLAARLSRMGIAPMAARPPRRSARSRPANQLQAHGGRRAPSSEQATRAPPRHTDGHGGAGGTEKGTNLPHIPPLAARSLAMTAHIIHRLRHGRTTSSAIVASRSAKFGRDFSGAADEQQRVK